MGVCGLIQKPSFRVEGQGDGEKAKEDLGHVSPMLILVVHVERV